MRQRAHAKDLGECLPQVGEGRTRAQVDTGAHAGAAHQHGHVLACVVGAGGRRIVAVIGRHNQQVVGTEARQQRGQARVKSIEIGAVAGGIVAVTVERIEVHQVGEDQAAFLCRHQRRDAIHAVGVTLGGMRFGDPLTGKQVGDLPHRRDVMAGGDHAIEQGLGDRWHGVVVTIRRARERAGQADERPRDHAPESQSANGEVIRRVAPFVELGHRHNGLVRGDLKHAVGRGVDDRKPGRHVLGAQVIDDRGTRGHHIADRRAANARFEGLDQFRGEPLRKGRERALEHNPHQLPMAGDRILAGRSFRHAAERAGR